MSIETLPNVALFVGQYDVGGDHNKLALEDGVKIYPAPAFGDAGIRRVSGLGDIAFSAAGYWNQDANRAEAAFFPNVGAADVPVSVGPAGMADGSPAYLFRCGVADYKPEASLDAPGVFSVSGQGSAGERLVRGTTLYPKTVVTLTGTINGVGRQLGAVGATQKVYSAIHVFAAAGAPVNVNVVVQSDDNAGFASATNRITRNGIAAPVSFWNALAGAITDDYWRVQLVVGGATTSFTFAVAVGIR